MHVQFHLYEFTPKSFIELGKQCSFEMVYHIIEVSNIDFFPKITHPFLRKYLQWTQPECN